MKLILHHLAKDIRAQRWLLLLGLLVVVLQVALDWLETQPDYRVASFAELIRTTGSISLIGGALWCLLLARLVQSEPVIGETSFWLTRPVPRRVYIPSKLLFIALFLTLLWLIPGPLDMLHFGVDSQHIARWLRNSLVWDGYLIIVLLWIATFTRTLIGFWAVLLGVLLAGIATAVAATYLRFLYVGSSHIELTFTRWALFVVILLAGLLASLSMQHARRKAAGGFTLGITCVVVALLAALFFPFELPMAFSRQFIWSSYISTDTNRQVHFSGEWQKKLAWTRNDLADEWVVTSPFCATDVPAQGVPVIDGVTASFQSGNGNPAKLINRITGNFPVEGQFDFARAFAVDFPGYQLENMGEEGPVSLSLFVLNRTSDHDLIGKTGELKLTLYGNIRMLVREAAIPLGGPGIASRPGEIIHVARFDRQPDLFIPPSDHDKPVLAVWTLSYSDEEHFRPPRRFYLLVNPPAHTAKLVAANQSVGFGDGVSAFTSKTSRRAYIPLRGDEALGQMMLYVYTLNSSDFFDTTLSYPNFSMTPP